MKNLLLLAVVLISFSCFSQTKNDSCKISLAGKRGGQISLQELQACTAFQYSDTNNCDYRLKSVELIIKDKMGTDIISQTTPKFLDDLKKAIAKMEKGTKISIEAVLWTDKKNSGTFIQNMKFVVN
ncbi:MAG: hypothetical protein IAF38_12540 [Bacteroidia bacterium]|nr:hypothetical protein [Bacteroidia bacterium]